MLRMFAQRTGTALVILAALIFSVFVVTSTAIADTTTTYTTTENGQQYTVKETTSKEVDGQGRTVHYTYTKEYRDKNGKLYKVVTSDKRYTFDQQGKWDYTSDTDTEVVYAPDGSWTKTSTLYSNDRSHGVTKSEKTTETHDPQGAIVSGTQSYTTNEIGKESKQNHFTYDPDTKDFERDVWDPSSNKWIPKKIKKTPTASPNPQPASSAPAPKPSAKVETNLPPVDGATGLTSIDPNSQPGATLTGFVLPPFADAQSPVVLQAGAQSEMVLQVQQPSPTPESGASGVLLLTEDRDGHKKLLQGRPDLTRYAFLAGLASGTLKVIELVTGWDDHGDPIVGSHCDIGNPTHIPGTQPVADVPPGKLAISEASSSIEPGDMMTLHLQDVRPLSTTFALDNQPVEALGISDNSAIIRFDPQTTLGHHGLTMKSGDETTKPLDIAVVRLKPHPVAPSHPGTTQTITVDVDGLAPSDSATMYFQLDGDAARMADGGQSAVVPVTDGAARVQVVGLHAGQIELRYRLLVKSAQFASGST